MAETNEVEIKRQWLLFNEEAGNDNNPQKQVGKQLKNILAASEPWKNLKYQGKLGSLTASSAQRIRNRLETKEKELYKILGVGTFNGFMKRVRKIFSKEDWFKILGSFQSQNLKEVLRSFEKEGVDALSFNKEVDNYITGLDPEACTVEITVEGEKESTQLKSSIYNLFMESSYIIDALGRDDPDVQQVLKIINQWDLESPDLRSFKKNVLDHLANILEKIGVKKALEDTDDTILQNMKKNIEGKDVSSQYKLVTTAMGITLNVKKKVSVPFPFGYTKEQWEALKVKIENQKKSTQELENQMRTGVKNFIIYCIERTMPDLKGEIYERVVKIINSFVDEKDNETFFMKGGNYFNGIIGVMGELQGKIIGTIITELENETEMPKTTVEIIGAKTSGGKQLKADILFGEATGGVGIQVKNYTKFDKIETNVGLDNLVKNISDPSQAASSPSFVNFFVNLLYGANLDGFSEEQWNQASDNFLQLLLTNPALLYSFDLQKDAENNVLFYFLGGKYIVPVSTVIALYEYSINEGWKEHINQSDFRYGNKKNKTTFNQIFREISFRSTIDLSFCTQQGVEIDNTVYNFNIFQIKS